MKHIIIAAILLAVLTGCQGTPRYGGGYHTTEGKHKPETREKERPQAVAPEAKVDPIALGAIIDRYLGKPYVSGGNGGQGYDCSGFVCDVYQEYSSVHLPRVTRDMYTAGRAVPKGDIYFGDLVFFDTGGKGVSHVGIYIGFDEFVHASSSSGIIISSASDKYWKKRFVGARRVLE